LQDVIYVWTVNPKSDMAQGNPNGSEADSSQLRERPSAKPLHLHNPDDAKQKVLELNEQEDKDGKDEDKKKTYGRVPDGTGKPSY
jgi:hypothetical protein